MNRALVIVNPAAGEQGPMRVAKEVARRLDAEGWHTGVEVTRASGHATEIARHHREAARLVVVGGDGTLRETLRGLDGCALPVGLVPIGKANVVARELGIPRRPDAAIRNVLTGEPARVDVGTVNDDIFLAMVGVGYDALVTEGVRRLRQSRAGGVVYRHGGAAVIYAAVGLPALLRATGPELTVDTDGLGPVGGYRQLVISNTETYATGWSMTPGADAGDGLLDHHLNRRGAPWFVLWTLGASALRRRLPPLVAHYGTGRSYVVRSELPFAWQIDGDSMPRVRELRVGVRPGAALLIAPPA